MRSVVLLAVASLLAVTAGAGPASAAMTVNVNVGPSTTLTYSPNPAMIQVGDTIHWIWQTGLHSTTSGSCSPGCTPGGADPWDSGQQATGSPAFTFDHTFNTPGTFTYFCSVHGPNMTGSVVVQATTAVGISSFRAVRLPSGVDVRWRTGAEARTLGFNVYRENAGRRQRLNGGMILTGGGAYSFVDRRAPRGEVAYWLQAVRLDGSRVWQGPVLAAR